MAARGFKRYDVAGWNRAHEDLQRRHQPQAKRQQRKTRDLDPVAKLSKQLEHAPNG